MYNWMFASSGGRKKRRNGSCDLRLMFQKIGRVCAYITAAVEGRGACVWCVCVYVYVYVCMCMCVRVLYGPL